MGQTPYVLQPWWMNFLQLHLVRPPRPPSPQRWHLQGVSDFPVEALEDAVFSDVDPLVSFAWSSPLINSSSSDTFVSSNAANSASFLFLVFIPISFDVEILWFLLWRGTRSTSKLSLNELRRKYLVDSSRVAPFSKIEMPLSPMTELVSTSESRNTSSSKSMSIRGMKQEPDWEKYERRKSI